MIVMTLGKGYDLLKNREKVVVKIVMVKVMVMATMMVM